MMPHEWNGMSIFFRKYPSPICKKNHWSLWSNASRFGSPPSCTTSQANSMPIVAESESLLLCLTTSKPTSLHWRHNERNGISNHQPRDCLLHRLFRCRSKETSKLHVTGLCEGNSPITGEFPAQRASYVENASIWALMLSCCSSVTITWFGK